jgi:hypothetical protein
MKRKASYDDLMLDRVKRARKTYDEVEKIKRNFRQCHDLWREEENDASGALLHVQRWKRILPRLVGREVPLTWFRSSRTTDPLPRKAFVMIRSIDLSGVVDVVLGERFHPIPNCSLFVEFAKRKRSPMHAIGQHSLSCRTGRAHSGSTATGQIFCQRNLHRSRHAGGDIRGEGNAISSNFGQWTTPSVRIGPHRTHVLGFSDATRAMRWDDQDVAAAQQDALGRCRSCRHVLDCSGRVGVLYSFVHIAIGSCPDCGISALVKRFMHTPLGRITLHATTWHAWTLGMHPLDQTRLPC